MYSRNMSRSVFNPQHNLNSVFMQNKLHGMKYDFNSYSVIIRNLSLSNCRNSVLKMRNKLINLVESGSLLINLRKCLPPMPRTLKDEAESVIQIWTRQCECVFAQRLRRGQQMFCLYSKLWEERALKEFINKMKQQLTRRSKELIFSAVGIACSYNWEENRIPKSEFSKETIVKDLDYISKLFHETLFCKCCNNRILVDSKQPNIEYCKCKDITQCLRTHYDGWMPFIDREDLIVWRRRDPSGPFQYKMYGKYNDVTAIDFLNVQIDIKYRKAWDPSAVELEIIDTDKEKDSNSDLVYWEMEWPRLFSNRDYVFKRRYVIDCERNLLSLMNISTEHPDIPEKKNKFRIKDYWSVMVIRPLNSKKDFEENGIEFTLTYFDNPGINIPQAVNTWVSMRAMPDFLMNLREAAKKYNKFKQKHEHKGPCVIDELINEYEMEKDKTPPVKDKLLLMEEENNSDGNLNNEPTEIDLKKNEKYPKDKSELNISSTHKSTDLLEFENITNSSNALKVDGRRSETEAIGLEKQENLSANGTSEVTKNESNKLEDTVQTPINSEELLQSTTPTVNLENESKSYFRYFHPYYYFS